MEKDNIIDFRKKIKQENNEEKGVNTAVEKVSCGEIEAEDGFIKYSNRYFGFDIRIPDKWTTLEHREIIEAWKRQLEKVEMAEETKKQLLENAATNSIHLFKAEPFQTGSKNHYGESGEIDNPAIKCSAQKVIMYPNHKSKDFIEDMKVQLVKGNAGIKFKIDKDIYPIIIGGVRFDAIEASCVINNNRDTVHTEFYSTLMKGYQLAFTLTYMSQEGKADLKEILGSVKFHN